MTNKPSSTVIHRDDTVFVALKDFKKGEEVEVNGFRVTIKDDIKFGHKVAIKTINSGDDVIKYGYSIGKATEGIEPGDWVHTHNVKTKLEGNLIYTFQPFTEREQTVEAARSKTLPGYVRKNGDIGIRNEIWIINTVGCINKTAEMLAKIANETYKEDNIDGVYHFPHPFGCSQLGDDLQNTQRVLSNLVKHPNAGGVLVLGLGCENNHIAAFKQVLGDYDEARVKFLGIQDVEDELDEGLKLIEELVEYASSFTRQPVPIAALKVGLKCGGSDGLSGITANPLVGRFSDMLVSAGGTTILTEVPEMFGAETILMNRAVNENVFSKIVDLVNGFKDYFIKHGQVIYENPSPGNKEGGITTLEEKSLGCVQKGGSAQVTDVLAYGERVRKKGLNLVQGPGNDLVSVTALTAAGAHIVLFTTGRGTPFGGPVPTVKVSTNTQLYNKKRNWIDFNAGDLIDGVDMDDLTHNFFDFVTKVASGEIRTKNEQHGFKEIAIFKDGVML